ncbi:hypothetical protein FRC10_000459, partial [Ceratobasidium sp. 414]
MPNRNLLPVKKRKVAPPRAPPGTKAGSSVVHVTASRPRSVPQPAPAPPSTK